MLERLRELWESEWKSVSRISAISWIAFYALFALHAITDQDHFLIIDNVNLVIHEGGHMLFSWLGPTVTLWGGTLLQWLVPLLLAMYFFTQRHTTGYVFSLFFFFENWLYTSWYMADARAQLLPLVGVGDMESEESMHDWYRIFSSLGLLDRDIEIARIVRLLGWLGMIAAVTWLGCRAFAAEKSEFSPD